MVWDNSPPRQEATELNFEKENILAFVIGGLRHKGLWKRKDIWIFRLLCPDKGGPIDGKRTKVVVLSSSHAKIENYLQNPNISLANQSRKYILNILFRRDHSSGIFKYSLLYFNWMAFSSKWRVVNNSECEIENSLHDTYACSWGRALWSCRAEQTAHTQFVRGVGRVKTQIQQDLGVVL